MVKNKAYKKWLIREGKDGAGIMNLLGNCLSKNHKMAHEIMKEAEAEYDVVGLKKATEMITKQCSE